MKLTLYLTSSSNVEKQITFGNTGLNQNIMNHRNDLEECILVGFPNDILVLNYCKLYTKYYIHIPWLFIKNELDLYVCQIQIKLALNIEHSICKKRTSKVYKKNPIYIKTYNTTQANS